MVGTFQDSEGGGGRHRLLPPSSSEWRLGFDAPLPTSRSIGEPLALDTAQDIASAFGIVYAECDPVVVPEVEFGEVAVQMFLADVLIDAVDAAFQDGEETFRGIGMGVAANVFISRVVDGAVAGEPLPNFPVDAAFVGAQMRRLVDPGLKDWPQVAALTSGTCRERTRPCRSTSATTAFFGAGSR